MIWSALQKKYDPQRSAVRRQAAIALSIFYTGQNGRCFLYGRHTLRNLIALYFTKLPLFSKHTLAYTMLSSPDNVCNLAKNLCNPDRTGVPSSNGTLWTEKRVPEIII